MANCGFQGEPERYVLGLLDPAEQADFEAHLARCASCRALVAAMAPLPGLMRHLRPDGSGSWPNGEEIADRAADRGSATLRRRSTFRGRRVGLLVAAALTAASGLGAAAGVLATAGHPSPSAGGSGETVTASDAATGVSGSATLRAEPTGTLLQLHLHGLPPGVTCRLWVTTRDGPQTAADWTSAYTSDITVQGTSSAAPYDITHIIVDTAQGRLLLSMPGP
jgi:hypothetical protein